MSAPNTIFTQETRGLELVPRERGIWDTACAHDITGPRPGAGPDVPWIECQAGTEPQPRLAINGPPTSLLALYLSDLQPLATGNVLGFPPLRFIIAQGADNAWTPILGAACTYAPANPAVTTGLLLQVSGIWCTSWRIDIGNPGAQNPSVKVKLRAIITRTTTATAAPQVWINPALAGP